ncbi:MAG: DUF1501 domain-containing protein [Phycisphaerales bacterium]|nr:DUF1501 domain-containing protein [Phycisphaerales bacterium]
MNEFDPNACDDYNSCLTRRQFMGTSAGALAVATGAAGVIPGWRPKLAFANPSSPCPNHVFIFLHLNGGPDGLSMVIPYGDERLHGTSDPLRPFDGPLGVPPPDYTGGEPKTIDLDGFFGLAPALADLKPAWDDGGLCIASALALTGQSYSHFTAFRWLGLGYPNSAANAVDGFMANHLNTIGGCGGVLRGVSLTNAVLKPLFGADAVLPIPDLTNFQIGGPSGSAAARLDVLDAMYNQQNKLDLWKDISTTTKASINLLDTLDLGNYTPTPGSNYGTSTLDNTLKTLAGLIKADVGLEMATASYGGWDTHQNQRNNIPGGNMWNNMITLSRAVGAFYHDLINDPGPTRSFTLFIMGEFGRIAKPNDLTDPLLAGTDHGYGTNAFFVGNKINGGQVINAGLWPGLDVLHTTNHTCNVTNTRDVCATTDPRDLLVEIFDRLLCNYDNLSTIFPDPAYSIPTPPNYQGIVRA